MTDNSPPGPAPTNRALMLDQRQADAMVRVAEASPGVRRRHQYFVWTQSQLQALLPHHILACGAYQRQRRDLVFETFHSVVLRPELLALLTDTQGALLSQLMNAWIEARNQPLQVPSRNLAGVAQVLADHGIDKLLVHGVARPQRPSEIESFFVLGSTGTGVPAASTTHLDLLLPFLHAGWQRVLATEREMGLASEVARAAPRAAATTPARRITERERQILKGVAEGKSNLEIGLVLGISQLTVKNHVQKILRKLECSNRAQAVALALPMGLLRDAGNA